MLDTAQIGYDSILWFYILNAFDYVNVPDAANAKPTDPELLAIQAQVKAVLDSGQIGVFSNMYWDNPGYVLDCRDQPGAHGALPAGDPGPAVGQPGSRGASPASSR